MASSGVLWKTKPSKGTRGFLCFCSLTYMCMYMYAYVYEYVGMYIQTQIHSYEYFMY